MNKPFHRLYRAMKDGPNSGYSDWAYIVDKDYANSPIHYIRAYKVIQDDLIKLFEYIEPSDVNIKTYSLRVHELLIRTCIEIEANFKAILSENGYSPRDKNGKERKEKDWNIYDYMKVLDSHLLDKYRVIIPTWDGLQNQISPYEKWREDNDLVWYTNYNLCKHDRHKKFYLANFGNLLQAISGLIVLLTAQFRNEEFTTGDISLAISGYDYYEGETSIGGYFRIIYPSNLDENDMYDFNWKELVSENDKFQFYNYNVK